ncbi:MAG TPA: putative quinol monooxygenase [Mycobacterium sp.]|uniref:putative quinol monooxygenase n=1 Tax=Mycobacterium sp. TaxID=1785 RepID=UPI002C1378F6|nr:putative quinol monooxygenase [Mycobacterium sp.]HME74547.1 putative quinol monooxygenase [Mycobacterium sp.]
MPELQVIARHTTVDGMREAVLAILPKLIEASRKEPGNLTFEAYLNLDEPRSYVLLERYISRAAFAEHRDSPHFKDLMLGQILPKLESRVVEQYDVAESDEGQS